MSAALFRIGARGSPLSRAQVARVTARMAETWEIAHERIAFSPIVTSGDTIQDRSLIEAGGKGLFTKELDEALLDGRIDLAVHSMKDLPSILPDGVALAAVPEREDRRDAFISRIASDLRALPEGAVVGTSSVRRAAQTLHARSDLRVAVLRGNVETRLRKLEQGSADATFLALAGLRRLGLEHEAASLVDPVEIPPAPCQGALAIVTREADAERYAALDARDARIETNAERAFAVALDGSCRTPIAAFSRLESEELFLLCELLKPDGTQAWRLSETIRLGADPATAAKALGARIGGRLHDIAVAERIL
jgi:hydroxymethylbilane synthase